MDLSLLIRPPKGAKIALIACAAFQASERQAGPLPLRGDHDGDRSSRLCGSVAGFKASGLRSAHRESPDVLLSNLQSLMYS